MKTVKQLLERRDTLVTEFEELIAPELADGDDNRALTEEEETRKAELHGEIEVVDERILELDARDQRERRVAEARSRAGTDIRSDVAVTNEPKVYGEGSEHSFIADLIRASMGPTWHGHKQSLERMETYEYQVATEVARNTDEGKRAMAAIAESYRDSGDGAKKAVKEVAEELRTRGNAGSERGPEVRLGMSAGSSSGGSFVTPVYYIQEWAPYRKPGRAYIDQCNKQPMPDYGMTIYIPAVQTDAAVALQETAPGVGEGNAVTETDPTAAYLSANLNTLAGQVIISQQLLDRAGPNFAFDRLVFDQLTRDYNAAVDQFVLQQSLTGAGTITYSASSWALTQPNAPGQTTIGNDPGDVQTSFYRKVSSAKAVIRTAAGVVMDPTHLFVDPRRWELIASDMDTLGRPLVLPNYAGVYQAAAAGNATGKVGYEGDTGYTLNGLPVFHDLNIPAPALGADQAVVGALDEVYVWEGPLVPRVIPQTYAQNLQILLQVYAYIAVIPRYPTAVQKITGTAMTLPF